MSNWLSQSILNTTLLPELPQHFVLVVAETSKNGVVIVGWMTESICTLEIMVVTCKCKRCRHKWQELWGTQHTNGIGSLIWCPRCFCSKIRRWFPRTRK